MYPPWSHTSACRVDTHVDARSVHANPTIPILFPFNELPTLLPFPPASLLLHSYRDDQPRRAVTRPRPPLLHALLLRRRTPLRQRSPARPLAPLSRLARRLLPSRVRTLPVNHPPPQRPAIVRSQGAPQR